VPWGSDQIQGHFWASAAETRNLPTETGNLKQAFQTKQKLFLEIWKLHHISSK
jgi:hypothetical protein